MSFHYKGFQNLWQVIFSDQEVTIKTFSLVKFILRTLLKFLHEIGFPILLYGADRATISLDYELVLLHVIAFY